MTTEADFADFAAALDAPAEGVAPILPEDAEISDFELTDIESARKLEGFTYFSVLAALAARQSGKDFSFVGRPPGDWELSQFCELAAIASTVSARNARPGKMGSFVPRQFDISLGTPISSLKYYLTKAKVPVRETHTSHTLALFICRRRGVSFKKHVEETPTGPYEAMRAYIPGYDSPNRPEFLIGVTGTDFGRVVRGAEAYADWHSMEYREVIEYREINPVIRGIAALFHQHIQLVPADKGGKLGYKVRILPKSAIVGLPDLSRVLSDFLVKAFKRISQAYERVEWRPNWAPTGKMELHFVEWMLERAYSEEFATEKNVNAARQFYERVKEMVERSFPQIIAPLGRVIADEPIGGLIDLCNGKVRAPNMKGPLLTFKNALDSVELSRSQERAHDVTTYKRDSFANMGILGSKTSVPGKVTNALNQLDLLDGVVDPPEVHVFGTGSECHFEATIVHRYRKSKIVWGDIKSSYAPPNNASFVQIDVTDPGQVQLNSGAGKTLISDVFPGDMRSPKFKRMLDNYLGAGYHRGIIKLYLGSDAEDAIHIDGRSLPSYVSEWAAKYYAVGFVQGGGPHSPEYFLVFSSPMAVQVGKDVVALPGCWIPPRKCSERLGKVESTGERPPEFMRLMEKYAGQWLAIKVLDMLRANIWRAPYAHSGVYPRNVPRGMSPVLGWNCVDSETEYWLTAKGEEKSSTVETGAAPLVLDEVVFDI